MGGETEARQSCHPSAPGHVDRPTPRMRSLHQISGQQRGELVAVADPPALRIPAQQPGGTVSDVVGEDGHAVPQLPDRRRSPTSATRRWAARCARRAVAPMAVSR